MGLMQSFRGRVPVLLGSAVGAAFGGYALYSVSSVPLVDCKGVRDELGWRNGNRHGSHRRVVSRS